MEKAVDIKNLRFKRDDLSDLAFIAEPEIIKRDGSDIVEITYMPSELGLIIVTPKMKNTFAFHEEDYNVGTYDQNEIKDFSEYLRCSIKEASDLVSFIFSEAIQHYMNS